MDEPACPTAPQSVSCQLEHVARALSDRDTYDWILLVVTIVASLATLAAVVVAVVTSVHATRVARESNRLAARAISAEQERHKEGLARATVDSRRRAGYRITGWHQESSRALFMHWLAVREGERPRTFSNDETAYLTGWTLGRELEADGHPHMVPLMQLLRMSMLISQAAADKAAEDPAPTVMHRARWQLEEAIRLWWREPDQHPSLLATFQSLDERSAEEFPDAAYGRIWELRIRRALEADSL
ncbi:hypothetical protein RWH43_10705 [Microbacterium sp. KSW2-21]|uniref:DUF4129 domain-containing protein n=1 Tax=Microbacterium algihabitans TaxID=3075992 RepID=A0ABU3RWN1_9MICO|nr:hypothetical protein [Microbacterium sp. KSW2-21]MDU0327224.1 hypothetical protein [Microbacterium sp. KSW2-21]